MAKEGYSGLAAALTERIMGRAGGIGDEPVGFGVDGVEFVIRAETLEKIHGQLSYDAIGTLGQVVSGPYVQFPDMAHAGRDKVLGALGDPTAPARERIALLTVAWPDGPEDAQEAVEVTSLEDYSGDQALHDLAAELAHTKTCRGDVQVLDADGLARALEAQVAAGRATEAAAAALVGALRAEPGRDGAPEAGALARENAELRRQLKEIKEEAARAADYIDMKVPDPAERYGADIEATGALPRTGDPETSARSAALEAIRSRLADIGMLADEAATLSSNEEWRRVEGDASERRELDALLKPETMAELVSCLRAGVSLGQACGTGSLTAASCEAALPVAAGCYLSFDGTNADTPVRTLKIFPSRTGTTAFDTQAFKSITCGYEYLTDRPESGDLGLADLKEIDETVFCEAPAAGYEEPAVWASAFDKGQSAYNAERGILVSCFKQEGTDDRLVNIAIGVEPSHLASVSDDGESVANGIDAQRIGRASLLTELGRDGGVEGLGPDVERIGASIAREPGEWVCGDDHDVFLAAENRIQKERAEAVTAQRELEEDSRDAPRKSAFAGLFR